MGFNLPVMNRRRRGRLDAYREGGANPALVLDFDSEYYRANHAQTTFDSALTATRAGNATMVDSDGKIKWAPHNLLTYSDDLTQSPWTLYNVSGGASRSGNTITFGASSVDRIVQSGLVAMVSGAGYTVKALLSGSGAVRLYLIDGAGSTGTPALITLTETPTEYTVSRVSSASGNGGAGVYNDATGTPATVTISNIHLYRSDLGGMVNNPDRGDSYVPTTSAARYLPRRGHHVYNGSEWVNEGLLVESEARTNYATSISAGSGVTVSTGITGSPSGAADATRLSKDATDPRYAVINYILTVAPSTTYTASAYFKWDGHDMTTSLEYNNTAHFGIAWRVDFSATSSGVSLSTETNATGNVENVGNGWYRCSATFTSGVSASGVNPNSLVQLTGGDGDSILIYGPQLEAGSTPSSYIPTAGATVTRAAETLVVPSANLPWPAPQYVTGTELVTNGDFSAGSTGWAVIGTGWSIASGLLSGSGVPANDYGPYQQATSVVAGVAYEATYTITVTAGGVAARVGNTQSSTYTSSGTYTQPFVATSTGVTIFQVRAGGSGFTGTIDNISVKEINPLAVSIAMDGRMTYADDGAILSSDGQSGTVIPWRWVANTTNYIDAVVDTESASTGKIWFMQEVGGVFDYSATSGNYLSPGVNVPFNIASRHGSTFINGAVDGVALTADLTPTALPNLSATNLQLGYTFMGTIGSFRIWADDIGDAGLVTATNPSTEPSLLLTFDSAETSFVDLGWSE